jgi:type I restriction enzyme M protein
MLDTDTKRRIDTARDILVGKVPDPKSQVEQITIALIYKFMDDMDAEAEELGGERAFFTGDFARYGWAKLMAPSLGGHEMLGLYGEGISKMPENPGIPALFRDIFKNAYLPYRDPETLKAFLKIIDEFSYDHSERLGDAFEYLLSVLGSQGDAGQFRTPRHIIDFMVEVLDPQKNETILDPACGTAGFLISAYKHILRTNTDAKGHSTLTPDEKSRLAKNFRGYDISPDMVRLSLVNLYLHGFTDPHIYEYDTLTSEERWNEFADVILANPPFMSPKGGIKPHKRFSIQAKRSEVLFVDYMAEHLTPNGRAAIIVPEGIIFQSQTAYKDLRKMLVENSLVAVISLPAGCFNPYSGVKTSILILDKSLARQSDTIGFFKVENDGFGLGAQRRAIEKNDLPQVQAALEEYLNMDRQDKQDQATALNSSCPSCASMLESLVQSGTALIVPKEKIAANGDYNLSGERYREGDAVGHHWQTVPLSEVCTKITDGSHNPPQRAEGGRLMLSSQNVFDNRLDLSNHRYVSEEDFQRENQRTKVTPGDVLLTIVGTIGRSLAVTEDMPPFMLQRSVAVLGPDHSVLQPDFLTRVLQQPRLQNTLQGLAQGVAQKGVYLNSLRELEIPLPPLEVQKEIVAEIEVYQKVINGARAVLDHYRPHIPIHPDWPMVRLGDLVTEECSLSYGIVQPGDELPDGLPIVRPVDLTSNLIRLPGLKRIHPKAAEAYKRTTLKGGEVLLCVRGTTGIASVASPDLAGANVTRGIVPIRFNPALALPAFGLTAILSESVQSQIRLKTYGATLQQINIGDLRELQIPLPPLTTQQAIVAEIEAEQALVDANRELITRFEQKIQATLARIWGEENKPKEDAQNES